MYENYTKIYLVTMNDEICINILTYNKLKNIINKYKIIHKVIKYIFDKNNNILNTIPNCI